MKIRGIRLVMVDWNGTLLNDLRLVYESIKEIFRTYQVSCPPLAIYRKEITADFMQFYWSHGIPRSVAGDDLNKIRKAVFLKNLGRVELNQGVEKTLRWCRNSGRKTAIVSAEIEEVLLQRLQHFGIAELFDKVRGAAWPKEPALKEVIAHFGFKPEQCLYVDDTFDGITTAKGLGIKTIGFAGEGAYNTFKRIKAARPDAIIENLWQLTKILS